MMSICLNNDTVSQLMNGNNCIGLWPEVDYTRFEIISKGEYLEGYFKNYFYPFCVSYVSRARVGMKLILENEEISKPQSIFVQPYSSHCVYDALSWHSLPNCVDFYESDYDIVYHQWGHKQIVKSRKRNNVLIEDSADSFFLKIDKQALFPNRGKYTIVSLPKIIPVPFGGLVIFRDKDDKVKFDQILKSYPDITSDVVDFKSKYPGLSNDIDFNYPRHAPRIDDIADLVDKSKAKILCNIEMIKQKLRDLTDIDLIFDFNERLPSNLYFDQKLKIHEYIKVQGKISDKSRYIYNYNDLKYHPVDLIPIHCKSEIRI